MDFTTTPIQKSKATTGGLECPFFSCGRLFIIYIYIYIFLAAPFKKTGKVANESPKQQPLAPQPPPPQTQQQQEQSLEDMEDLDDESGESAPTPGGKKERRSSHKIVERRYRNNLNDLITSLCEIVPTLSQSEQKEPKPMILKKTRDYVTHLQGVNVRLLEENQKLRGVVKTLGGTVTLEKLGIFPDPEHIPSPPAGKSKGLGDGMRILIVTPSPPAPPFFSHENIHVGGLRLVTHFPSRFSSWASASSLTP